MLLVSLKAIGAVLYLLVLLVVVTVAWPWLLWGAYDLWRHKEPTQ